MVGRLRRGDAATATPAAVGPRRGRLSRRRRPRRAGGRARGDRGGAQHRRRPRLPRARAVRRGLASPPLAALAPPVRFRARHALGRAAAHVEFGAAPAAGDPSEERALAALDAYLEGPALQYAVARQRACRDRRRVSRPTLLRDDAARTSWRASTRARAAASCWRRSARPLALPGARSPSATSSCSSLGSSERRQTNRCKRRCAAFPFARTHPALDAWRDGHTGYPLVDAGIRQLHETGWMHPHVRAIAASFLCFDLGVRLARRPRRVGAALDRGRSGLGDGQLAMDRRRRRRHGTVPAHLQPRSRRARSIRAARTCGVGCPSWRRCPTRRFDRGRDSADAQLPLPLFAGDGLSRRRSSSTRVRRANFCALRGII